MSDSPYEPAEGTPSPEDVRAQAEKILRHPEFADSERMRDFLRFIVEERLSGRAEGLKGYIIGVEVFGRDESFDPQIDPIVRVEAGRLRRKLQLYYSEAGRHDPIHIEVPKGSYVPVWRVRPPLESPLSEGNAEGAPAAYSTESVQADRGPLEPQGVKRKLTTILAADVAGYSRLMSGDEAGTLAQLKTHRKKLTDPKIAQHHGRIVKTTGDGVLVEFGSVVEAVQCAVEIQREMAQRNADLPQDRRIEFRIGINLGDIIIEGEDIYGDGVNIAARLEGLAKPGGICISAKVFEEVRNKLKVGFEDLGPQEVKNIPEAVRTYRVRLEKEAAGSVTAVKETQSKRWGWAVASAVAVLLIGGAAVWNFYLRPPRIEPASVEKMAFPLPKKPSIAVLPFTNMSGDPEQEYFSDGITEDIITDLSKLPNLFVIARNSTFTYKGKPVKVQQVAEELGVRYVLEGSFRRAGERVRITAQLVDATTGRHAWAERYDREFKDVFTLQDEVTQKVVNAMEVNLTEGEQALIRRRQTNDPKAYEHYRRGLELFRRHSKVDMPQARRLFEKAVELDPNFAAGWHRIGSTYHLPYALAGVQTRLGIRPGLRSFSGRPWPLMAPMPGLTAPWASFIPSTGSTRRRSPTVRSRSPSNRTTPAPTRYWG